MQNQYEKGKDKKKKEGLGMLNLEYVFRVTGWSMDS